MRNLFISPHNDDESLFGAFSIMAHSLQVVVVYDSYAQVEQGYPYCDATSRREETKFALQHMGAAPPLFLALKDNEVDLKKLEAAFLTILRISEGGNLWVPQSEVGGNRHHEAIAQVADATIDKKRLRHYLTYTARGKSDWGTRIDPTPAMIEKKLLALGCYSSQITIPSCRPHFLRSQEEYLA